MITCKRCGKDNQEHYKFCLGCGGDLAKPEPKPQAAAPSPSVAHAATESAGLGLRGALGASRVAEATPADGVHLGEVSFPPAPMPFQASAEPSGARPAIAGELDLPPSPPSAPAPSIPPPAATPQAATSSAAPANAPSASPCPSCGTSVPTGFLFCGNCGTRMEGTAGDPSETPGAHGVGGTVFMVTPAKTPAVHVFGKLILIRSDGTEAGSHPLVEGTNLIGRGQGALFDADAFLSPRHAEFVCKGSSAVVRDLRSLNGVFVKLTEEEEIEAGTLFRIGQELLRFDPIPPPHPLEDGTEVMGSPNPGFWGRLGLVVGRDVDGSAFPLFGEGAVLGRERGDILFPEDGYVSGTHARITHRAGRFYLSDMGSSNGTFLRIRGERSIRSGSFLLMGQQLFKVVKSD